MPHIQSRAVTGSTVTSLALAYLSPPTAGNCLVAGATASGGTIVSSFADNAGNTWSKHPETTGQDADHTAALGVAPNCAGGATTVTVNYSGSTFCSLSIAEYSGVAASAPVDKTATATGFGTSAATSAVTTTVPDEVLIVLTCRNAANSPATLTPGTNFTERTDTGGIRPGQLADRFVTSTGSYAGAATLDSSSGWGQAFMTLKGASGQPARRRLGGCAFAANQNPAGIRALKIF